MNNQILKLMAFVGLITLHSTTFCWHIFVRNWTDDSLEVKFTYSLCGDDKVTLEKNVNSSKPGKGQAVINAKQCLLRKVYVNGQEVFSHSGYRTLAPNDGAEFGIRKEGNKYRVDYRINCCFLGRV